MSMVGFGLWPITLLDRLMNARLWWDDLTQTEAVKVETDASVDQ
jgi:hypothetical protein